jgi:uncharacterized protein (TIGR02594 family)
MVNLPPQYSWLKKGGNPRALNEALKLYGITEIKGAKHNPEILKWADEVNPTIGNWYESDEKAWCGLFVAVCLKRAGYIPPSGFNALRALEYAKWGRFIPSDNDYGVGDIGVFTRTGGGHVGFLVGHDAECYHVLGGNQGDAVSVTRIKKFRIYAVVRPPYKTLVPQKLPALLPSGGVSENEA